MSKNIIEKIWDAHVVKQNAGHPVILAIDLILLHEVTSAQAFKTIEQKGLRVFDVSRCLATVDHSIPTRKNRLEIYDEAARIQVETLRDNCKKWNIPIYDFDSGNQGIVHVIGPELGFTQPGLTIVCGDSHTSTHGAFGSIAFGIGTSEVGHSLATGCLLLRKPKTMRVKFSGKLKKGVYSKDVILKLIAEIGIGGGNGHVIEYTGEAISAMSMEERMTICNMSIECGARAGLVAPDETTFRYLSEKKFAPKGEAWKKALEYWKTLPSDKDAKFDKEIEIDVSELQPMVTWGTNPEQASEVTKSVPMLSEVSENNRAGITKALNYIQLSEGDKLDSIPIEWAFIGSCTNGRIEDLRLAAQVLKGRKVSPNVTMYVVPGSEKVMAQAQAEGLDKIFEESGAQFRMPGCSMCLGMNDDLVPPGKRCISSSNRNFAGRQGPGSLTHLASPATVAASAIEGRITTAERYL
jgi:3-isopropylmalate/(R)-2-methylmalate dehydratase large subunit